MKVAGGYQFGICEDGHIHLFICDKKETPLVDLSLETADEAAEFAADLAEMIEKAFTEKAH